LKSGEVGRRRKRGILQSTNEHHLQGTLAREAAAMETVIVTCARHSGLQREILRIYLRTNKIMMVLLTLTTPIPGFYPSLLPPGFSLCPLNLLPDLSLLPSYPSQ
jgi:hypothetical protein